MTIKNGVTMGLGQLAALLLLIVCLACSQELRAQSDGEINSDVEPPIIELEELTEAVADSSQVFTVQVAEDGDLADVILYYRRAGQQAYSNVTMAPLASSSFYTATVETDPTDLRALEYYIQARDVAGNRTVSGFAFAPFIRSLSPPADFVPPVQPSSEPAPTAPANPAPEPVASQGSDTRPFYKRPWFQITLGVIAAGLVASSLGGGDDDTRQVPVTITLE